jgi:hypothetical protein
MRFLGRWLSHSLATALALVLGIVAMQAPAFTRDYAGALLQVSAELRRDVDQREDSARQFYGITIAQDDELVKALQAREPSNAESLARSLDRVRNLQAAYDTIDKTSALLQPLMALRGAWDDTNGYRAAIWRTSLRTYHAQLDLGVASAVYGLAGLMLGSLIAQLVLTPFRHGAARRPFSARTRW